MKLRVENMDSDSPKKGEVRIINYPFGTKEFCTFHFPAGFFKLSKVGKTYYASCPFTGEVLYTVSEIK